MNSGNSLSAVALWVQGGDCVVVDGGCTDTHGSWLCGCCDDGGCVVVVMTVAVWLL